MSKPKNILESQAFFGNKTFQNVSFGNSAQKELLKGAEILYNAVKSTMGPSGRSVIIDNDMGPPSITKDGVTVAKSINLKQKLPKIGAELLKEVASKTNETGGDGTSTATVLGYNLLANGIRMISNGHNPIMLKKGMDYGTMKIIDFIKEKAIKVRDGKDIISVGTISANGDSQIGELLSEAISKVGEDGIITIEPAKSVHTQLEVVEGMQFDGGFLSPYFVTNQEKLVSELINPYILVTNRKLSGLNEILPLLEKISETNRPLLLIADEIEGEVLHTLILNKMNGNLINCAVKAPSYGENRMDLLSDIALVTETQVVDASFAMQLKNMSLEQLGTCEKVIVSRHFTTIVGKESSVELKEKIKERVSNLKSLLGDNSNNLDDLKRNNYKKRLAKLAGGVAVVKVGGSTELEIMEKKDRVEDALNATVAAVQEGILPGGGTALFYAAEYLEKLLKTNPDHLSEDEVAGAKVICETCRQPLKVIVENAGKNYGVIANNMQNNKKPSHTYLCDCSSGNGCAKCGPIVYENDFYYGYDAYRHEYGNLVDKGIIDPLKVERCSLEYATSVAGLVLTCDAIVVNTPAESKEEE